MSRLRRFQRFVPHLELTVECRAEADDFAVSSLSQGFVAAREEPYTFPIAREQSDEAPQVGACPAP